MARKVKGCITAGCVAKEKKIKYKIDDNFCLKCGHELVEVCKKCYKPLPPNSTQAICDRCIAEAEDKKNKRAQKVGAIGGAAAGVAGIASMGKKAFDLVKKL